MSKFSDMLVQVSNIKVEKPDNPYANISNTTVPLSDIISIQGVITRHNDETKAKDDEIRRLNEQVLQSSDMEIVATQMQENINSLTKKLEEMTKRLEGAENNADSVVNSEDYKQLQSKFDDLQKSLNELQVEKDNLQVKHDESITASEVKENELSDTIDALSKEVEALKTDNDNLANKNTEYETTVADLKIEIENLKSNAVANVQLTPEYIRDHGFFYTDLLDGKIKKFFTDLVTIIFTSDELAIRAKNDEAKIKSQIRERLGKTIFVTDSDYHDIIVNDKYYYNKYTANELFNVMIDVVCKEYTGSDLEEFVFKPFALQYGFDTMSELVDYLRNKDNVVQYITADGDTVATDGENSEINNANSENLQPVSVVFDEDHIQQLVYDAVYQCFNDCEFDTNMNYISKLIAFTAVSALHLTPFSCPGYFKTYDDKRNAAIVTDMLEVVLRGIFKSKIERIKPPLDGDTSAETERAMNDMAELDEKVDGMLEEHINFFDNDLGDLDDFNSGN